MDKPLRDYIGISIELVLFGLILGIIVFFAGMGQNLLSIGQERKAFNQELGIQRDLAQFDNRPMTGDDVILAIKENTKLFNMTIETEYKVKPDARASFSLSKNTPESAWEEDLIRTRMGTNIKEHYKSITKRDNQGTITSIIFERVPTP